MMKIVLITGGNRGIGLEIGKTLASKGHTVLLGSRKIASIPFEHENVIPLQLDVTDRDSIGNAVELVKNRFGKLDVLINNAGIGVGSGGSLEADLEDVKTIMETNFYGVWRMSQQFLDLLKNSKEGRIINLSSGMGALDDLVGGYAGYRLSKSALNALTILMANELTGTGIKLNAVCPGWVRTDMGGAGAPGSVQDGADTPVWLTEADDIPHGKFLRNRKVIPW